MFWVFFNEEREHCPVNFLLLLSWLPQLPFLFTSVLFLVCMLSCAKQELGDLTLNKTGNGCGNIGKVKPAAY